MADDQSPSVVCLGFFDGVHRGHLSLIREAGKTAREEGFIVCAHTFDRAPGEKLFPLTTLEEREALLRAAGADTVAVSPFDDAMRHMPGDAFFRQVVLDRLHARHVVCGDDHRFGYRGGWGVRELKDLCRQAGVGLTVAPPVTLSDGSRISSSAIRAALASGNLSLAEDMLGRPLSPRMLQWAALAKNHGETLA